MDTQPQIRKSKPTDWITAIGLIAALFFMTWEYRVFNRESIRVRWAAHEYMVSMSERAMQRENPL